MPLIFTLTKKNLAVKLVNVYYINMKELDCLSKWLAAVSEDGKAIQFIDKPSEAVQLAAVSKNGYYR